MKYVNFLFHIYQPPVQQNDVLDRIVREAYEPLTRVIRDFADLRFTLNVNFSLIELLNERSPQVIENIRTAYENGTLELTATGAYHPLFPLIPQREVQRQLELNQQGNERLLAANFQPEGVFPPELALTCGRNRPGSAAPAHERVPGGIEFNGRTAVFACPTPNSGQKILASEACHDLESVDALHNMESGDHRRAASDAGCSGEELPHAGRNLVSADRFCPLCKQRSMR